MFYKYPFFRFRKFPRSFYQKLKLNFLKCFWFFFASVTVIIYFFPLICLYGDGIYRFPNTKPKFCSWNRPNMHNFKCSNRYTILTLPSSHPGSPRPHVPYHRLVPSAAPLPKEQSPTWSSSAAEPSLWWSSLCSHSQVIARFLPSLPQSLVAHPPRPTSLSESQQL